MAERPGSRVDAARLPTFVGIDTPQAKKDDIDPEWESKLEEWDATLLDFYEPAIEEPKSLAFSPEQGVPGY